MCSWSGERQDMWEKRKRRIMCITSPIRNKYFHLLGCQTGKNVSNLKATVPHHLAEAWHHYLQVLHLVYYEMLPNRQEGMREVPWRGLIWSLHCRNAQTWWKMVILIPSQRLSPDVKLVWSTKLPIDRADDLIILNHQHDQSATLLQKTTKKNQQVWYVSIKQLLKSS